MGRGLPRLPLACTQCPANIGHGLPPSSEARTHQSTNDEWCLTKSFISSKDLYTDVYCGHPALYVAYIALSTDIECWLLELFTTCTHQYVDVGKLEVVSPKAYMHVT